MSNVAPEDVFSKDSSGNSSMTRLEAEVQCNHHKSANEVVVDSSLTHGDLRKLLAKLKGVAAEAAEGLGNAIGEAKFGG